jgi:phytoene dehydrogenase-like protein
MRCNGGGHGWPGRESVSLSRFDPAFAALRSFYDAIVIGAGHNGLVCAAYLARARESVLVLERRHVVGGACVTEELWPGFQVSVCAYVNSLFRPEIVRELELKRHGFQMLPRRPSSFTPFPDGRYLLLGPDADFNAAEIGQILQTRCRSLPALRTLAGRDRRLYRTYLDANAPRSVGQRPGGTLPVRCDSAGDFGVWVGNWDTVWWRFSLLRPAVFSTAGLNRKN